jgi:hypothetical protein
MFKDSLRSVPKSSMDGKAESSKGSFIKAVSVKTVKEKVILNAKSTSRSRAGMGKIMAPSITTKAKSTHPCVMFMLKF